MPAHSHFICSLGIGNYVPETYRLGDGSATVTTELAPAAVARLVGLRGARASVLVTPEAEATKWNAQLMRELGPDGAGLEPQAVRVPLGATSDELQQILLALVGGVDTGEEVVLDVSLALRHLPFAYFAALTYLTAYKDVTITGIYNAAREAKHSDGTVPIVALTSLFDLTRWYHALRSAKESGDLAAVGRMTQSESSRIRGDKVVNGLKKRIAEIAPHLGAGLPLEIGIDAALMAPLLDQLATDGPRSPALRWSLEDFATSVRQWALPDPIDNKSAIFLTVAELQRQLAMTSWYIEHDRLPTALLLLREWLISLVMLQRGTVGPWLGYSVRRGAERRLNGLSARRQEQIATEAEDTVGRLWDGIRDRRNLFAHAGFDKGTPSADKSGISTLLEQCRGLLSSDLVASLPEPTGGTLLLTPLGNSPGVLFTAVKLERPDKVIVVTSEMAQGKVMEALAEAGAAELPCQVLVMQDPHAGFGEARSLLKKYQDNKDKDLYRQFVNANKVVVNVTGGTTVMQHVVDVLAREARRVGAPIERVAMVDRRTPIEQREHAYVLGERVLLGGDEAGDDDAG